MCQLILTISHGKTVLRIFRPKARKPAWILRKKGWHLFCQPFMVPVAGLEPARCRHRWILSPLRLPIPSHRQMLWKSRYYYISFFEKKQPLSHKNLWFPFALWKFLTAAKNFFFPFSFAPAFGAGIFFVNASHEGLTKKMSTLFS